MPELRKFPRTPHLAGSRLQPGDDDLPLSELAVLQGQWVAITEKVDGANAGISFDAHGQLCLQSRGHFLTGGPRERQFALFKAWATTNREVLFRALGHRYVIYGEWLYAKHTIFYDALPHYFLAFDVLDTEREEFLATSRMLTLLHGVPLAHTPQLWEGQCHSPQHVLDPLGPSRCKSERWREHLCEAGRSAGVPQSTLERETDLSDEMEGLYVKVERDGRVEARYKFVRASFRAAVDASGSHWLDRPIVPNQLRDGATLYTATP